MSGNIFYWSKSERPISSYNVLRTKIAECYIFLITGKGIAIRIFGVNLRNCMKSFNRNIELFFKIEFTEVVFSLDFLIIQTSASSQIVRFISFVTTALNSSSQIAANLLAPAVVCGTFIVVCK